MKIWIAEKGCYEDRYVEGVYASLEGAKAANPIREDARLVDRKKPIGWSGEGDGIHTNGCDWEDRVTIYALTLDR